MAEKEYGKDLALDVGYTPEDVEDLKKAIFYLTEQNSDLDKAIDYTKEIIAGVTRENSDVMISPEVQSVARKAFHDCLFGDLPRAARNISELFGLPESEVMGAVNEALLQSLNFKVLRSR